MSISPPITPEEEQNAINIYNSFCKAREKAFIEDFVKKMRQCGYICCICKKKTSILGNEYGSSNIYCSHECRKYSVELIKKQMNQ